MKRVIIDQQRCKGCGLCTQVCPRKILVLSGMININGYHAVECTDEELCMGCGNCAAVCPVTAFEIYKPVPIAAAL
jgi:2-oxoglutarate ferredoxin oxidoreductase subunit delta